MGRGRMVRPSNRREGCIVHPRCHLLSEWGFSDKRDSAAPTLSSRTPVVTVGPAATRRRRRRAQPSPSRTYEFLSKSIYYGIPYGI
jgi:hypothetical protein